jgi:hypothetical protein
MSLSLAFTINVAMNPARSAPRSDPANSYDFLPSAKRLSARSAALFVRQIRPSSRNDVKPSGNPPILTRGSAVEFTRHFQFLCGRYAPDAHVGPFVVVGPEPLCSEFLRFLDAFNDVLVKPFMSSCRTVRL